jgi:hypothetical protein
MRIIAVLAALLLLGGCGSDAQVSALKADPMGGWSRPGLHEVREFVTEPGTSLGMPRYAGVHRIMEIQDGTDAAAVIAEVRTVAEGAGWSVRNDLVNGDFIATKPFTVDGLELRGRLVVGSQDLVESPGAARIFLSLDAYPA